ncbi:hypothetical protein ACFRAE_06040 [Sphingobacterium sp. HJSM2_6]|uniref:hypothetical protein n=1 Tax=Sphingobacterium sp. HJSM2_6 TaxID=3366264 RepID=UPI003BC231A6
MQIIDLLPKEHLINDDSKLREMWVQFQYLIKLLKSRDLPSTLVDKINEELHQLNLIELPNKNFKQKLKSAQTQIIKDLEKDVKLVPIGYYRTLWLALGMAVFGIPFGLFLGLFTDNMGLLGVGLPIGLGIGVAVGTKLDNKAAEEGRQLDVELK